MPDLICAYGMWVKHRFGRSVEHRHLRGVSSLMDRRVEAAPRGAHATWPRSGIRLEGQRAQPSLLISKGLTRVGHADVAPEPMPKCLGVQSLAGNPSCATARRARASPSLLWSRTRRASATSCRRSLFGYGSGAFRAPCHAPIVPEVLASGVERCGADAPQHCCDSVDDLAELSSACLCAATYARRPPSGSRPDTADAEISRWWRATRNHQSGSHAEACRCQSVHAEASSAERLLRQALYFPPQRDRCCGASGKPSECCTFSCILQQNIGC